MKGLLAIALLGLSGCFLPLSTAAPQSATTVGQGNLGATFYTEAPTVDLLATEGDPTFDGEPALAPAPTMTFQVAFGVTDRLDLEAALDGQLWLYLVPLPLGASIGGRYQVSDTDQLAVAVAARAGYVTGDGELNDSGDTVGGKATYGAFTVTGQLNPRGAVRPGLALSWLPARVEFDDEGSAAVDRFSASAIAVTASVTFALGGLEVAPFLNGAYLSSDRIDGEGVVTGGLSFALRPQAPRPAPPPPPPHLGPPGGAPPPPQPPG